MRHRLPAASVLITAAAILLGGAALPATAGPAADTITFSSCNSAGPGVLRIAGVISTTPLTSLTAHIMSGTTDLLDVSDFTLNFGTTTAGNWETTTPITQQQLPLGTYTISVDATDSGGTTVTDVSVAGAFPFQAQAMLPQSPGLGHVDYDHQSVTFAGTLTSEDPDGTITALAGQPVTLQQDFLGTFTVLAQQTTGTGGSYSMTFTPVPNTGDYQYAVVFAGTATISAANSGWETFQAQPDSVQVTAAWAASPVKYGSTATLTGTVTYQPASAWQPLAGATVDLYDGSTLFQTAVTRADGTYTMSFPAIPTTNFKVEAGGTVFLAPADAIPPPLGLILPVGLTLTGTLSPSGRAELDTCLSIPTGPAPALPLTLEYSGTRHGPWKSLGLFKDNWSRCPRNERGYFRTLRAVPLPAAYYRVAFPGSPGYEPSASPVLHLWKYPTKITSFTVSPGSVARNGYVTVRGRLWQHRKSWKPYAGRKILILFTYKHKLYGYKKEPVTSTAGWFSARLKVFVSAPWFAEYLGDATHFASASASVRVTAAASIALRAPIFVRHLTNSPLLAVTRRR